MKNIFIVDSYPNLLHSVFKNKSLKCYRFNFSENDWILADTEGKVDNPHGTAIGGIIAKNVGGDTNFFFFDIYSEKNDEKLELLINALEFIESHFKNGVVNCSVGSTFYDKKLEVVSRKLSRKMLIVSAFDNAGAVSYPAAFDFVIGVDTSFKCISKDDFVVVKNSFVDIRGKGGVQRVPWVNPDFTINQGSSFACAYITAYIVNNHYGKKKDEILSLMEVEAKFIYDFNSQKLESFDFQNKKAAIVPFNKEVQSVFNFSDMLSFEITGYFDFRYSGNIGKKVEGFYNQEFITVIQNVEDIKFDEIDFLIIGHLEELSSIVNVELKRYLLEKCLEFNKDVVCFDSEGLDKYYTKFSEKNLMLLSVDSTMPIDRNKFGKLSIIRTPVLGIFGTTSKQGKFTLQLQLKKVLTEKGYNVGFLGTEPTGLLFDFEYTYPIGYFGLKNNTPEYVLEDSNYMMNLLDKLGKDLIIVGSQSGTIPQALFNMGQTTLPQLAFLQGTRPDAIILCVNLSDSIKYLKKTIAIIENLVDCDVVALSLYPYYFKSGWGIITNKKERANQELIFNQKKILTESLQLPVFLSGEGFDGDQVLEIIENYFSEK